MQECVLIAWQKLPKFNADKGKAFNYFCTIMLGHLRCLYRKAKDKKHLKEQYKNHLDKSAGEATI